MSNTFYGLDFLVKLGINIARTMKYPDHFDTVNNRNVKDHVTLEREALQIRK
ncbi:hypothetical protein SAMN02982985_03539 [Rugamonas rubra]|uniref:Uncharacterized protein n=1 Tax=Rugamonas rubra TaxID=758825 RepID=A0A1I4PQL1_9BURK|nr:hypothetical protein SAMN02982985_03539 [Rugamonas rubra]